MALVFKYSKTYFQKLKMDDIEKLFKEETFDSPREIIQNKLINVLDDLSASCRKFLDIVENHKPLTITALDKERINMIIREMVDLSSFFLVENGF